MLIVRDATEEDLDKIMALLRQINHEHHVNAPQVFSHPDENRAEFWLARAVDPELLFVVAESEGQVMAMVTASIAVNSEVPFLNKKKVCRVGTIVVDEANRNAGLGRELMSHVEQWALRKGVDEIRLEVMEFNAPALQFYRRCGYTDQSRIMSKPIA
jgi:ribosomal protein S18 acetylase RimI-like enzyme